MSEGGPTPEVESVFDDDDDGSTSGAIRIASVAALGGLLFGYETAVINGATKAIEQDFNVSSGALGFAVASALIGAAEAAKIAVAETGQARIDLSAIEAGMAGEVAEAQAIAVLGADMQRIVEAADVTLRQAGVTPDRVASLYFTGGSTGFRPLAERIAARFPNARAVRGDRFASVAQGLGVHARMRFGAAPRR